MPAPRIGYLATLFFATEIAAGDVSAADGSPGRPNVIVIMADDLGFGDVSCNGATRIQTPNIDKLAKNGRRFTSGYCTAATCTPTRYSFLTGTYAFRVPKTGVAPPNAPALIAPGTETVASILKRQGYATAIVGKWHLGLGVNAPDWNGELKPGPLEVGFDHCFILPTTNDRVPQVIVENHRVRNWDANDPLWVGSTKPSEDHPTGLTHRDQLRMDWSVGHNQTIHNGIGRIGFYTGGAKARFRDEDLADLWVQHSAQWMTQQRDRPFFLFFSSHDIHVPRMPHERFQKKSPMGWRGDAILEFDWQVGEITKTVERLGLTNNTIIILCSDNGPVLDDGYKDGAKELLGDHQPAGPFRGGKYSVYEGGTRIPFIVSWPGVVRPGVSDSLVSTVDLSASLAALHGMPLPDNSCLDSCNLASALFGPDAAPGRDFVLQQDNSGANFGLRAGDWKLIRQSGGAGKAAKSKSEVHYQLFDLATDSAESRDRAPELPDKVNEMKLMLEKTIASGRTRPKSK